MFRAFAKEILRRLRAVLPPEAKMILPKESLSQAMEALKKNTMRATTREQKLIRKCAAAMKLRPSDYKLEKMKKYSGIQLPFYESLALIPLQDLRVKEVKKEVVETAVGRRRYAIWEPQGQKFFCLFFVFLSHKIFLRSGGRKSQDLQRTSKVSSLPFSPSPPLAPFLSVNDRINFFFWIVLPLFSLF